MENEEIEIFKIFKDTRYNPKGALWEVSNYGNVRKNGKEYLPFENSDKYLLFGDRYSVHRAVAELFVENPENKPTVDHKNRCRSDNRAANLRWATYEEQAENRDNDAHSKLMIGNKYALGHSPSEEVRAKMRAAALGNKNLLGYRHSEESKAKMRAAHIGYKHSEESKAKIRAYQKGKKKSDEHRANLSKALMGNKNSLGRRLSEETKAKIGAASLGRIPSEEAKAKISKYVSNTVWIIHPMTNEIKRIPKEQIHEYLDKGYVRGRKTKK